MITISIASILSFATLGCVSNEETFRTQTAHPCVVLNADDSGKCQNAAIEEHKGTGGNYTLAYVEFDDQGLPHDRMQIDSLVGRLKQDLTTEDLSIVIYVHGWKHDAWWNDEDVTTFKQLLTGLSKIETQGAVRWKKRSRELFGIYVGWRGRSLSLDRPLARLGLGAIGDWVDDLTFWGRKHAAEQVAAGSVRELVARVKELRDETDRFGRYTRMMTIGHSFGGLVIFRALAQYYADQAAASDNTSFVQQLRTQSRFTDQSRNRAPAGDQRTIDAYGDLVVIINPAFSALDFEPIRQLVKGRPKTGYAPYQRPVFVEVTSTADSATGVTFDWGVSLGTIFQSYLNDERSEAITTIGHYQPFITHLLNGPVHPADEHFNIQFDVQAECRDYRHFNSQWRDSSGYLRPTAIRNYSSGARLQFTSSSSSGNDFDPNDPFWIVQTDDSMITSHTDIHKPVFVDFIRRLYDDVLFAEGDFGCPLPK